MKNVNEKEEKKQAIREFLDKRQEENHKLNTILSSLQNAVNGV